MTGIVTPVYSCMGCMQDCMTKVVSLDNLERMLLLCLMGKNGIRSLLTTLLHYLLSVTNYKISRGFLRKKC